MCCSFVTVWLSFCIQWPDYLVSIGIYWIGVIGVNDHLQLFKIKRRINLKYLAGYSVYNWSWNMLSIPIFPEIIALPNFYKKIYSSQITNSTVSPLVGIWQGAPLFKA